jgi:hypothetical protein
MVERRKTCLVRLPVLLSAWVIGSDSDGFPVLPSRVDWLASDRERRITGVAHTVGTGL